MSGAAAGGDDAVRTAVPIADLSVIDAALRGDPATLKEAVKKVRPADLGRDLSRRPIRESAALLEASDDRRGAAMLRAAHPAVAAQVLAQIDCHRAGKLLGFLPTDQEVAILALLDPAPRARIEQSYDPEDKAAIDRLLAHPEAAVGRLMTTKIWRCERTATAGEALAILRAHADDIEVAVNCYVTDGATLVGVVPLRALSIAEPAAAIAELMTPDPICVREDAQRGDAAEIIDTHDFLSLPIVDAAGALVGAVRVDDLLGAALEQVGTGFLNQGGVSGKLAGRAPYFLTPILRTVRSRLTWLVLLFVAETATGTVLRYFDDELAKVVALSFFIPLLIGTGGNAGSQTVSTIIRALALGEVRVRDVLRVVRREVTAGFLLGVLLGTIAFFRALLWGVDYDLAICVAVTILVVCTWANAVGAAIPLVAQRFGIDPTVISAPLITTLVDASGLFIYFSVAKLLIASLSTSPIPQDTPPWQTIAIVSRDVHLDAASDDHGHLRTLAITGPSMRVEVPPTYLAKLPPLAADTLVLRGEGSGDARKLIVSFATGGDDNEHVRIWIQHGHITQVAIARQTAEGKDRSELRAPPD